MSVRLYLVRHGEPAADWGGNDPDPGLSPRGRAQAEAAARRLRGEGALAALTSPLRRCRETAAPFAPQAMIEPAVSEIPTPADVADRRAWLSALMRGRWADAPALQPWRAAVIARLVAIRAPTVVFSHFVAINVAVGAAREDDAVLCFQPAHASITVLETDGAGLRLVALGGEAGEAAAL